MEDRCEPTEILSDINLAKQQQAAGGGMTGHHGNLFTSSTKKFRKRLSFFFSLFPLHEKEISQRQMLILFLIHEIDL